MSWPPLCRAHPAGLSPGSRSSGRVPWPLPGQPTGQRDGLWRAAPPCPVPVRSLRVRGKHVLMARPPVPAGSACCHLRGEPCSSGKSPQVHSSAATLVETRRGPSRLCSYRRIHRKRQQAAPALCLEVHVCALSPACCRGSSEETLTASSNRLNAKSFSNSRPC